MIACTGKGEGVEHRMFQTLLRERSLPQGRDIGSLS